MWIDGYNGVAHHIAQNIDFAIVAPAELPALRAHARQHAATLLMDLTLQRRDNWCAKLDYGSLTSTVQK